MSGSPLSLNESAIAIHEFYSSLVKAGFTEEQAMTLTAVSLNRAAS